MYTFTSGTFSFGGLSAGGTVYMAPPKTDAQKLEEARLESNRWRGRYESLFEGLQELVEQFTDDDEDDE